MVLFDDTNLVKFLTLLERHSSVIVNEQIDEGNLRYSAASWELYI